MFGKGKWVLITGATSGIGNSCAQIFAQNGYSLILTGRRNDRLEKIQKELESNFSIEVKIFSFDVRNRQSVENFGQELKSLQIVPHILINNAGLASGKDKLQAGSIDDWEKMIDTNLKGLLYITRAVLPAMIEKNEGHVINIGSTAGHLVYPEGAVYNATKYGVKALNEGINLDLVGTALRCCSIDPGACETEFSLVRFHGDSEKAAKVYEGYEALKPNDVADAVFYVTQTPPHVNITNLIIYPTAQRSAFVWDKK